MSSSVQNSGSRPRPCPNTDCMRAAEHATNESQDAADLCTTFASGCLNSHKQPPPPQGRREITASGFKLNLVSTSPCHAPPLAPEADRATDSHVAPSLPSRCFREAPDVTLGQGLCTATPPQCSALSAAYQGAVLNCPATAAEHTLAAVDPPMPSSIRLILQHQVDCMAGDTKHTVIRTIKMQQ